MRFTALILISLVLLASCRPKVFIPKPRGYYYIDFPKHEYQIFNDPTFPYSFEYPVYSKIFADTSFFGQKPENPYWINIDFPSLGGRIYISYKRIDSKQTLEKLLAEAYQMTSYHTKKADYIDDYPIHKYDNNIHGALSNVTGNAASAYQFYVTDSVKHYLRGALYFDVTPNADSLKPVNEFIKEDMVHMLETLHWH